MYMYIYIYIWNLPKKYHIRLPRPQSGDRHG